MSSSNFVLRMKQMVLWSSALGDHDLWYMGLELGDVYPIFLHSCLIV